MRTLLTDLAGNPISITSRRSRVAPHKSRLMALVLKAAATPAAWTEVIRRAKAHPEEIVQLQDENMVLTAAAPNLARVAETEDRNPNSTTTATARNNNPQPLIQHTSLHPDGNTPLHVACRFDPPQTVIWALAQAAGYRNSLGLTPLHIAASHRCNALTLKALIQCFPQALRLPSKKGDRTPMHYACLSFRGLELDAFEILLEAALSQEQAEDEDVDEFAEDDDDDDDDGTITMDGDVNNKEVVLTWKDSTGCTPLALLFRRYRERVRTAIVQLDHREDDVENNVENNRPRDSGFLQADMAHLWGKARLVVARMTEERLQREGDLWGGATEEDGDDEASLLLPWVLDPHNLGDSQFRIVHASVALTGMGCPPEMIRLAIAMYPDQVKEMDEDGNLVRYCLLCFLTSDDTARRYSILTS